jgi:sugar-specific transcriptional regulator TrmB
MALVALETPNAKMLSKASGLAMCDVYRTVNELLELGLAETHGTTVPKEFRATPPETAMAFLINKKRQSLEEAETKANCLVTKIRSQMSDTDEQTITALVPYVFDRIIQITLPLLAETKKSLRCVQTNIFFQMFTKDFFEPLEALLKRKVHVKFFVETRQAIDNPTTELTKLLAYPNFMVRFAPQGKLAACILMNDDSSVFVSTSLDPIHTSSYWSINPCFIHVVKTYFDSIWKEAH